MNNNLLVRIHSYPVRYINNIPGINNNISRIISKHLLYYSRIVDNGISSETIMYLDETKHQDQFLATKVFCPERFQHLMGKRHNILHSLFLQLYDNNLNYQNKLNTL